MAEQHPDQHPSPSRVAVITGASRGLGEAIALRLAADGWSVGCIATSAANAEPVAEQCRAAHGVAAIAVGAQVQDRDAMAAALATCEAELGPVTLMINNAGIAQVTPFLELDPGDFTNMVDINLHGVFHGSQLAAQQMVANSTAGSIISIGSIAGRNGFPNRIGYCGTKAAVHHMTRVMALDLAAHDIRVNCVAPGYIRTDMVQDLIDAGRLDETPLTNRIPQRALGAPAHIADTVAWLASDEAAYITGETITVDGGWVAHGHI